MNFYQQIKKPKFMLMGLATHLPPPLGKLLPNHQPQFLGKGIRTTRKMDMEGVARSAYTSWLRYVMTLDHAGIKLPFESVGEIGPGDSFSMGLAAMLTGTNKYYTLDVVDTATNFPNEVILDELIKLFHRKTPIPGNVEFPKNRPRLNTSIYPSHIITDALLERTLAPERISGIREAIRNATEKKPATSEIEIVRLVKWDEAKTVNEHKNSMDIIISGAAMEHVDDVERTYEASAELLRDGGYIAHAIDYKCHDTAGLWNGHLTYSDRVWKMIRGKSVFFINRYPHSFHLSALKKHFDLIDEDCYVRPNALSEGDLAPRFRGIPESDLVISESFIVAQKRKG